MKKVTKMGLNQFGVSSPPWIRKFKNFWVGFTAAVTPLIMQWGFPDIVANRIILVITSIGGVILAIQAFTGQHDNFTPDKP